MRKKILLFLIVLAAGIWLWNTRLVLIAMVPSLKEDPAPQASQTKAMSAASPVVSFVEKGKSPLVAYKESPAKAAKAEASPPKSAKPAVPPPNFPDIKVTGIMWNETNPIAMIELPGGVSTAAKSGQILDAGIKVIRIEKARVQFGMGGERVWIVKQ